MLLVNTPYWNRRDADRCPLRRYETRSARTSRPKRADNGRAAIRQSVIVLAPAGASARPRQPRGDLARSRETPAPWQHCACLLDFRPLAVEVGDGWADKRLRVLECRRDDAERGAVQSLVHRRGERFGLPTPRLHDLRHGLATKALSAGAHVAVSPITLGRGTRLWASPMSCSTGSTATSYQAQRVVHHLFWRR